MPRKLATCPNCTRPVDHPEDGCVLGALIQVVRERGNTSERKLRALHAKVDADRLWNELGKIVDDLEGGEYSE